MLARSSAFATLLLTLTGACAGQGTPAPATAPSAPPAAAPPARAPAPAAAPATAAEDAIRAALNAPDRSPEDRALDEGRRPLELLEFAQVRPGMRVAELGAGGGYTSELLARVVGPTGTVFAQNSRFILERFAEKPWSERLTKPVMKNVVRVDREFDDPLPPEATNLDLVLVVLFYHDTVWLKVDRARMNRAVFEALKPGGRYLIVDHSARAGSGLNDVESLHRIEQAVALAELRQAGFVNPVQADFLRNPGDTRDWNASPRSAGERRGTSDRFVLMVEKPSAAGP